MPAPRTHLLTYHGVLAPHAAWRSAIVPEPAAGATRPSAWPADAERLQAPRRLSWAALLRRVFALDVLTCSRCGGRRRVLGVVTEPHALRRLLASLDLAAEPPPARAEPSVTVP